MKKNYKNSRIKQAAFFALFSLFTVTPLFILGCNESLYSTAHRKSSRTDELKLKAERIIGQALFDSDPRIRASAIEVVADTKQTRFMLKVQQLLNDEFVPVRFAAVLAIADTEHKPAEKAVQRLLTDEQNVRIAAAYALSRLGSPDAINIVHEAVTSKDQTVRANAVMLLGKSGGENAIELLIWAQRDKKSDDRVRLQALEARAKLKDERVLNKLWAILFSTYADDRIMAVKAIGALGTEKAKEILMTKLDDDVLEVRLAAAQQLGMLGDNTGEPEVLDVFTKKLRANLNRNDRERVNILTTLAIGQIKSPALNRFLPKMLENESKLVRIAAAKAVIEGMKN